MANEYKDHETRSVLDQETDAYLGSWPLLILVAKSKRGNWTSSISMEVMNGLFPNSRRLRPLLKDVNDMLIDQWDMKEWVLDALSAGEMIGQECCVCGAALDNPCYEFFYDDQGILYCNRHWPGAKSA